MDDDYHHHTKLIHKYLCFYLSVIIVCSSVMGATITDTSKVNHLDLFDYVAVHPHIQTQGNMVNFHCVLRKVNASFQVILTIIDPSNELIRVNMTMNSDGKYVCSDSFLTLGIYSFYVTVCENTHVVVNTTLDDFWIARSIDDKDSDGMPDVWENTYGFDPTDPHDGAWDTDGDGLSNVKEFEIGSNPFEKEYVLNSLYRLQEKRMFVFVSLILFLCIVFFSWYAVRRTSEWY